MWAKLSVVSLFMWFIMPNLKQIYCVGKKILILKKIPISTT